jgi:hypothetical protein
VDTTDLRVSPAVRPVEDISLTAARLSLLSGAAFLVLLAALHFVRPDLDPSWSVISEYALGDYGWLMTIAFLAWGLSAISLFVAIRSQVQNLVGRIGLVFLLIGAAGLILAAIFPTDPITTPPEALTTGGTIHSMGAMISDGILIGGSLLTLSLVRKNPNWSQVRKPLIWAVGLAWIGAITFTASMAILLPQNGGQLGPEVLIGWQGRFSAAVYAVWLITAAFCAIKVHGRQT